MIDYGQFIRIKNSGYPVKDTATFNASTGGPVSQDIPDEAELMEWLRDQNSEILLSYLRHWICRATQRDITEVIVRCVEEVEYLKSRKDV